MFNNYLILIIFLTAHPILLPALTYAGDDFLTPVTSSFEKVNSLLKDSIINQNSVSICYNYGCKTQKKITISTENIQSLKSIFKQFNQTQYGERRAIAHAVALLENISGSQSPVNNDKAKNYNDNGVPGKMDCIDSTVNTTHYLEFINNLGLIKQHRLVEPAYRSPYLMGQHWSAQIEVKSDGKRYVVDSWQTSNGKKPIIQDIESWTIREEVKDY